MSKIWINIKFTFLSLSLYAYQWHYSNYDCNIHIVNWYRHDITWFGIYLLKYTDRDIRSMFADVNFLLNFNRVIRLLISIIQLNHCRYSLKCNIKWPQSQNLNETKFMFNKMLISQTNKISRKALRKYLLIVLISYKILLLLSLLRCKIY